MSDNDPETITDNAPPDVPRLVRRREDFDRGIVSGAIDEALTAIGKARMKLPLNLAHELQHAHDHLLNARDWVRLYTPNKELTN